jgi:hypothetical protein
MEQQKVCKVLGRLQVPFTHRLVLQEAQGTMQVQLISILLVAQVQAVQHMVQLLAGIKVLVIAVLQINQLTTLPLLDTDQVPVQLTLPMLLQTTVLHIRLPNSTALQCLLATK